MTHYRTVCLLGCIATILLAGCKRPAASSPVIGPLTSNTLIAVVNGSNLYAGTIEALIQRTMAEYQEATGAEMTDEQLTQQRRQLMEQLITETIVRQKVAASDIAVPADEFEQEFTDIVTNQFGTQKDFEEMLAKNDVTSGQFARAVYDQLKLVKLVRKEMSVSDATPADAREYYAAHSNEFDFPPEVALSHILIKAGADDAAEVQSNNITRLEKVRAEILAGLPFADAAKKYSECPSAKRGGYIGTIQQGDRRISELIANAAFATPVSNVSKVVESEHGYHLFYVTQYTPGYTASFEQIEAELLQALNQDTARRALQQWLVKARDDASVEEKF